MKIYNKKKRTHDKVDGEITDLASDELDLRARDSPTSSQMNVEEHEQRCSPSPFPPPPATAASTHQQRAAERVPPPGEHDGTPHQPPPPPGEHDGTPHQQPPPPREDDDPPLQQPPPPGENGDANERRERSIEERAKERRYPPWIRLGDASETTDEMCGGR
jgi:hypothetical protein